MLGMGDEGRRQAYLSALGIPVWTARRQLPHAAPTESLEFVPWLMEGEEFAEEEQSVAMDSSASVQPEPEEFSSGPEDAGYGMSADGPPDDGPPLDAYLDDPDIRAAAALGAQSGKALTRQLLDKPAPSAPTGVPARTVIPESESDLQPVRFQFALFPCGRYSLVVPRFQLLSPSEDKLLGNILTAMTGQRPPPLQFAWPMVNNHAIPQHRRAACEALSGFLLRQDKKLKGFIVLGEHEHDLAAIFGQSSSLPVTLQPGLGMLLQQPMRKRDLWLALQA
jgi:hypothetical protein